MREILETIIEEKYDYEKKKIIFSFENDFTEKMEIVIESGIDLEGSFTIHVPEDRYTYGYISASDARMECISHKFSGSEEIPFRFHGSFMEKDEICKGHFLILSNQGQFELPFEVRVKKEEMVSSEGEIRNLLQFCNLARVNWQEAVRIFYSRRFEELIYDKEPQLYLCYQALAANIRNEHNMDQFLIAAGKKQRMGYFVEDNLLFLEDPQDVAAISLGIVRSGWGYTRLDVETEGDFVFVEKEIIRDDDFLGNRYKLPVYVDSQKLHAGRNFGRIILWDNDVSVEVPIEVYCTGNRIVGRDVRREKRKNNYSLTKIYEAFRLKEMNASGWLKESDQLVQRMMTLDEEDAAARLYFAQILITAERYNEAGWILENMDDFMQDHLPELEAYHLYLTSLIRRDKNYTKQVAEEIAKIYKEQGESWRTAWLLLYVSQEYEKNMVDKWSFLEEQFDHGCRSPLLYFEAIQLLNRNPALLRKLERYELQVIYYGNKKGVLSPELLEQLYYLTGKTKEFSGLLYRVLENCYKKTHDERIVKEICTLLIKSNRVEKKYYQWFRLAIEANIRITNLYEYYMMSLDLDQEEEISKIVLLYFTYQNNLDDAHTAYLYSYIVKKRQEYPDIYESYCSRIKGFVKEQIQKERMNHHLDILYHTFLTEEMLDHLNAAAMIHILFSYQLKAPNSLVKRVLLYQADCLLPYRYKVISDTMWLPIYAKESCVVWEDLSGNRFPAYPLGVTHELAEHPIVKKASVFVENDLFLDVYLYNSLEMTYEGDAEWLTRLHKIWRSDSICPKLRREAAVRIMKYYYHTEDKGNLAAFLENLPMELFTRREASEAIKYMVFCRMDELAYRWMNQYSPVYVDSKISASLLSAIIKKRDYAADEKLLCYCFETFEKGKYTKEILNYLVMYYSGTVNDLYQIWKAAYACELDTQLLSERLLIQMLFTDTYVKEHGEVFRKYLKEIPGDIVIYAYLIRKCYAYYLEGESLETSAAEQILSMLHDGLEVPRICELACLKYYIESKAEPDMMSAELLQRVLKKQLQCGIHLPWFMQYRSMGVDLSLLEDKSILEYHTCRDVPVKFRFLSVDADMSEAVWKVINMYPVCRRVFFTEHILFFGEALQYEILEEVDGTDVVMKSGVLKKTDHYEWMNPGRFREINALLEANALQKNRQFEKLLEDYMKKDYINEHLFTLLQ